MTKMRFFFVCAAHFLLVSAQTGLAQDERFFRDKLREQSKETLFAPKNIPQNLKGDTEKKTPPQQGKWFIQSPEYQYDLNGDGLAEKLIIQKRNALDWIVLNNHKGELLFEKKLPVMGTDGRLYKARLVDLGKKRRLLILYFYEGQVEYINFEGRARLHFLAFDDLNLSQIYYMKGPAFFTEQTKLRDHYHLRNYYVDLIDFDQNGVKDISVKYGKISRIYSYLGKGRWSSL